MCLACVGACPEGALLDTVETPQLRFIEAKCVQCGICAATCPEHAITLAPRLSLRPEARQPRDPGTPSRIGIRWIDNGMGQKKHDEQEHVNGGNSLCQPRTQSCYSSPYSNAPAASTATPIPPRFTIQALRRVAVSCEPMSMSLNR